MARTRSPYSDLLREDELEIRRRFKAIFDLSDVFTENVSPGQWSGLIVASQSVQIEGASRTSVVTMENSFDAQFYIGSQKMPAITDINADIGNGMGELAESFERQPLKLLRNFQIAEGEPVQSNLYQLTQPPSYWRINVVARATALYHCRLDLFGRHVFPAIER